MEDIKLVLGLNCKDIEVLEKAIWSYGYEKQLTMAIEEASEFIKAVCKLLRSGEHRANGMVYSEEARKNVLEELADVMIMITQADIMLDRGGEAQQELKYKIERLDERLKRGGSRET